MLVTAEVTYTCDLETALDDGVYGKSHAKFTRCCCCFFTGVMKQERPLLKHDCLAEVELFTLITVAADDDDDDEEGGGGF